jgi:hypothetical protein
VLTLRVVSAVIPPYEAWISAEPFATAVASPGFVCPVVAIVATVLSEDDQLAKLVTLLVDPSA